jgi:hypothetical protein
LGVQLVKSSFQEPGCDQPRRRIDTIDGGGDRDPLRGPGPQGSGEQAEGVDPAAPLVAGAGPRQPHEGHQVAGHLGGGVIRTGPGLGERDHRLLDGGEVGVGPEHGAQVPDRRITPLVEGDHRARLPVPVGEEPDGRRRGGIRPDDQLEEPRRAVRAPPG